MSHQSTTSPDMRAHLEALRERKAKKLEAREAKAEADELVELELEEKYERELGGERGIVFEIVDTPEGPIVVKLGDWVHYKKFITGKQVNGVPTPEDVVQFALANLAYPDREKFLSITNRFAGVATRCANKIVRMHQGEAVEKNQK